MSASLLRDQIESDGDNALKPYGSDYPVSGSDTVLVRSGYSLLDEYRTAVERAGLHRDQAVLDVATGSGRMAYTLASAGYKVISGDIDKTALGNTIGTIGHLFPGELTFTYFDALHLPYRDGSFGSVVSANSLHEIDDPMTALAEMTRVVSAEGSLVIVDFNANGFDEIAKAHLEMHGKEHRRGTADYDVVNRHLESSFRRIRRLSLSLNDVWIAEGRRGTSAGSASHSRCFACGRENPSGLDLHFLPDGRSSISCECTVPETYQGYPGVVQGASCRRCSIRR